MVYRATQSAFGIRTGDWFIAVKKQPRKGDLVLVSTGIDELLARYQGTFLQLSNGSRLNEWSLIGVVRPLPDHYLGYSFSMREYLSHVN